MWPVHQQQLQRHMPGLVDKMREPGLNTVDPVSYLCCETSQDIDDNSMGVDLPTNSIATPYRTSFWSELSPTGGTTFNEHLGECTLLLGRYKRGLGKYTSLLVSFPLEKCKRMKLTLLTHRAIKCWHNQPTRHFTFFTRTANMLRVKGSLGLGSEMHFNIIMPYIVQIMLLRIDLDTFISSCTDDYDTIDQAFYTIRGVFLQHAAGLSRLVQSSTPERLQGRAELGAFESARHAIALGCADWHARCFLEQHGGRASPSSSIPRRGICDRSLGFLVRFLQAARRHGCVLTGKLDPSKNATTLYDSMRTQLAALFRWRAEWEAVNARCCSVLSYGPEFRILPAGG